MSEESEEKIYHVVDEHFLIESMIKDQFECFDLDPEDEVFETEKISALTLNQIDLKELIQDKLCDNIDHEWVDHLIEKKSASIAELQNKLNDLLRSMPVWRATKVAVKVKDIISAK